MPFKVNINGDVKNLFKEDLKRFSNELSQEFSTTAKIIESGAKISLARQQVFNTGGLRNSVLSKKVSPLRFVIGTPKDYAQLQEEGAKMTRAELGRQIAKMGGKPPTHNKGVLSFSGNTVLWKARPYLVPALDKESKRLARNIKKIISR